MSKNTGKQILAKVEVLSAKQAEMSAKQTEISKDVNNLKSVVAAVGIVISMLVAGSRYFTIVPIFLV